GGAEGGGPAGVPGQGEAAVDRAPQGDAARARGGERRVGPEADRVVVGLRPRGGDTAPVERRAAGGVGGEAAQGRAAADGAAKGGGAAGVHREAEAAVDRAPQRDVIRSRGGQRRV